MNDATRDIRYRRCRATSRAIEISRDGSRDSKVVCSWSEQTGRTARTSNIERRTSDIGCRTRTPPRAFARWRLRPRVTVISSIGRFIGTLIASSRLCISSATCRLAENKRRRKRASSRRPRASPFGARRRFSFVVRRTPCVARHASCAVRRSSLVARTSSLSPFAPHARSLSPFLPCSLPSFPKCEAPLAESYTDERTAARDFLHSAEEQSSPSARVTSRGR